MGGGIRPGGPGELTAEWLTASLRETGTISDGTTVTSFDSGTIGEGEGLLGQLARVKLGYEGATGGEPKTLIAKFPSEVEGNRDLANLFHFYEREVRFYEDIAEEVELRTPKRYFSHGDDQRGVFILLMEDMEPRRVGHQAAGFPRGGAGLTGKVVGGLGRRQQVAAALQQLGQVHPVALAARQVLHQLLLVATAEVE